MIKLKTHNLYRHQIEQVVKDNDINSLDEFISFISCDYNDYSHEYAMYERFPEIKTETFMNRINQMWVYPVFFIVAPFRYLMFGVAGVNSNTRLHRILTWLIGEY